MSVLDHFPKLRAIDATIDSVSVYGVLIDVPRHFSFGTWTSRVHGFYRATSNGHVAWTEGKYSSNPPHPDPATGLEVVGRLKGMTITEALQALESWRGDVGASHLEYAEALVLDLAGKVAGRSTLDLLDLPGGSPVPGLFCILENDPEQVKAKARLALEQNLRTHLKVKLFGDPDVDLAVVCAAREVMGAEAYLVGDVNSGYRKKASPDPIDDIVTAMERLRDAGLTACEDPAAMEVDQWVELQDRVDGLDLVADAPMRPAWRGLDRLRPGMARVSNTHPACMGSILDAVRLGRQIQATGNRLMVGDSSLVGPACPMWTQIAIGQGADWVEAIEKPQESTAYAESRRLEPISRTDDGRFALTERRPGFGIDIDEAKLRSRAMGWADA